MDARAIPKPELRIKWASRHQDRWRAADLEVMEAHTVDVRRSPRSSLDVFTGVPLRDLLTIRGRVEPETALEVHFGFFRKKILRWRELDPQYTIVTDQRNGKTVRHPFWLVAVDTHGRPITIKSISQVVVKRF
jgi:hypothetical protein